MRQAIFAVLRQGWRPALNLTDGQRQRAAVNELALGGKAPRQRVNSLPGTNCSHSPDEYEAAYYPGKPEEVTEQPADAA